MLADITLATIYVTTGEPRGTLLANRAITSVAQLHSVHARERLGRLAAALETRPSTDNRDLVMLARRVAGKQT